jgi:hypothetical protein
MTKEPAAAIIMMQHFIVGILLGFSEGYELVHVAQIPPLISLVPLLYYLTISISFIKV